MLATRSLLALTLCTCLAGTALAQAEARKGTRNYRPDGAATVIPEAPAATDGTVSRDEKLTQCMETWDKGTHITKSHWRDICLRQLDAR
jgi:hypothetical protein